FQLKGEPRCRLAAGKATTGCRLNCTLYPWPTEHATATGPCRFEWQPWRRRSQHRGDGRPVRVILMWRPTPAMQERGHDHQPVRGTWGAAANRGGHRFLDHSGAELFAFLERHDGV